MIIDVFSRFDGHRFNSLRVGLPLWFFRTIVPFFIYFSDLWIKIGWVDKIRNYFFAFRFMMVRSNGKGAFIAGFPLGVCSLFMVVLSLNLSGNIPYFFPNRAHFIFGFRFALSFWTCLVVSSMLCRFEQGFISLVPRGCPLILVPFMVVVEIFSGLLRPLTLVLRLALNLSAGKVILSLFGGGLLSAILTIDRVFSSYNIIGILLGGRIFAIREVAIACIQCYIFCVLLSLYTGDHRD